VPQAAAVWSADPRQMWSFPARFLAEFFHNHGMLGLRNRPQWRTVQGGSHRYVEALIAKTDARLHLSSPIDAVHRHADHVTVTPRGAEAQRFDEVVLATHSDQALDLLGDATDHERDLLGAIPGTLEAWLSLRGLRTLHVRLDRAESNATELVRRLSAHRAVAEVRYPGFGGIVSVVLAGGADAGDLLTRSTTLWVHATSLGGVESTFERRRRWKTEPATIPEGLVRLSVGIEDVEDLWSDLALALDQLPT